MSAQLVEFWLLFVMVFSFIALLTGYWLCHTEFWRLVLDKPFKIGFILLGLGLGVQTYRSIFFLNLGYYPVDAYFPTWIVKDMGFCLIVFSVSRDAFKYTNKL